MNLTILTHHGDGHVSALATGEVPLAQLGPTLHTRRLSCILPQRAGKRWLFRHLRKTFGDKGVIAAWTRRWRGPWEVHFPGKPGAQFTALTRKECLQWERDYFTQYPPS